MAWDSLPTYLLEEVPVELDRSVGPHPGLLVCDPPKGDLLFIHSSLEAVEGLGGYRFE